MSPCPLSDEKVYEIGGNEKHADSFLAIGQQFFFGKMTKNFALKCVQFTTTCCLHDHDFAKLCV